MTATIYWQKVAKDSESLNTGSPSEFIRMMEKAFGDWRDLNEDHLEILRGMASAYPYKPNPFEELFGLIEQHGDIRLWEQY